MIGMLKGIVEAVGSDEAVIDVNGVGYLVGCASRTLARLEPGQQVTLHIETHVREDAFRLFGFLEDIDRDAQTGEAGGRCLAGRRGLGPDQSGIPRKPCPAGGGHRAAGQGRRYAAERCHTPVAEGAGAVMRAAFSGARIGLDPVS